MLVALLLVILGLVLVKLLGDAGRLQDCVMSGRTNCAPIDTDHNAGTKTPPHRQAAQPLAHVPGPVTA